MATYAPARRWGVPGANIGHHGTGAHETAEHDAQLLLHLAVSDWPLVDPKEEAAGKHKASPLTSGPSHENAHPPL